MVPDRSARATPCQRRPGRVRSPRVRPGLVPSGAPAGARHATGTEQGSRAPAPRPATEAAALDAALRSPGEDVQARREAVALAAAPLKDLRHQPQLILA